MPDLRGDWPVRTERTWNRQVPVRNAYRLDALGGGTGWEGRQGRMNLIVEQVSSIRHDVWTSTKQTRLGWFLQDHDGFFYFWPDDDLKGFWSEEVLRFLADNLQKLNAHWEAIIEKGLNHERITTNRSHSNASQRSGLH